MGIDSVIVTRKLTKKFGDLTAVDSVDLEIGKGELFGLVGPDGAGKTTSIRMLSAIMNPSAGDAFVLGYSTAKNSEKIKEHIGYMPQKFGLYEDLTVLENINFYADIYGVPKKGRSEKIDKYLNFSRLLPFKKRLAGNLSGGMKQKLGLSCALIHTPQILFLDEPTNGVDPISRRDFWQILYDLIKDGITIFLSTAYLDEAERCTKTALIDHGHILIIDTPDKIKRDFRFPMIEIWTDESRKITEQIGELRGVERINIYGDRMHVVLKEKNERYYITDKIKSMGFEIKGIREILPSLEDVFITLVSKK